MNENNVKEILAKHQLTFPNKSTIWAKIIPTIAAYQNGLGKMMYVNKEHVIHIHPKGIAIIAVEDTRGKLEADSYVFIPNGKILSVRITMKRLKFYLVISTNEGNIEYKIRRNVIGSPWHKENLANLLLRLE